MNKKKIVQLARIPCAGSGYELSQFLNQYSDKYESRYILGNEYSKGCENIPFRAFPTDLSWQTQREECLRVIKEADIIHVHHDFWFEEIENLLAGKKVIVTLYNLCNSLQYRDDEFNRRYITRMKKYATILTVADQPLQKKVFSDISTIIVPLIKNLFNENIEKNNKVPHIVFSPTNRDRGGIGKKMYYEVLEIIENIKEEYKFTFDLIEGVPYEENLERKKKADIIIDDVDPDYEKWHNTSLESACFGAVALTNYNEQDYPFLKTNIHTLKETLTRLLSSPKYLKNEQERIVKWRRTQYYPKRLLKIYEDLYSSEMKRVSQKELKDLTVFLITCGSNPNYEACKKALENQTVSFKLEIIKDVAPMSKAFQTMLDTCQTPFYVQIDEDMVLKPYAIEKMYESITHTDVRNAMVCFRLHDTHLNLEIQGVKIYKHEVFKKYPYQDCLSCEMNQLGRMKKDGWSYLSMNDVLGDHSPYWTEELIFDRYFIFMQKSNLENLPQELLNIYLKNPTKLNLYAFLGAISGIITPEKMKSDKNFKETNPICTKMDKYFKSTTALKFLPDTTNKTAHPSLKDFIKKLARTNIPYWYALESCAEIVETKTLGYKSSKIIIGINPFSKEKLITFLTDNGCKEMQEIVHQFDKFCVKIVEDKDVTDVCQIPCFDSMVNVPNPVQAYLAKNRLVH